MDDYDIALFKQVELTSGGVPVGLEGEIQRRMLVVLLKSSKDEQIKRADLVRQVWGYTPSARTVTSTISRLRSALSKVPGIGLVSVSGKHDYLVFDRRRVDVHRFSDAAEVALRSVQDGAEDAETLLDDCLEQWTGTPFGDLSGGKIDEWRTKLNAQHRDVRYQRLRLSVVKGREHEVVDEVVELSRANPRHRPSRDLAADVLTSVGRADEIAALPDAGPWFGATPPVVRTEELLTYLRALQSALSRAMRWHPGENIAATFSERSVRADSDPSASSSSDGGSHRRRRELVRGDQSWADAVELARLVVVLGDAGYGKTWQLRAHGVELCDRAITALRAGADPMAVEIPLWAHASSLISARDSSDRADQVIRAASEIVANSPEAISPSLRASLVRGMTVDEGRLHVLVDALDELFDSDAQDESSAVLSWLAERVDAGRHLRVVVTSRPVGYRNPFRTRQRAADRRQVPVHHLSLGALTSGQVLELWRNWFAHREEDFPEDRLLPLLTPGSPLAEHVRVPLIAAFCAWVAEVVPAARTRVGLYEQVLRRFIASWWKQGERTTINSTTRQDPLRQKQVRHALEQLAWHMSTEGATWRDAVDDEECERLLATKLDGLPGWTRTAELVTIHGLLVRLGGDPYSSWESPITWVHPTVHEYLAAHRLITLPDNEIDHWLDHGLHRPEWEATFLFASELEQLPT
ncbi:BTAD domain-containing putative transcriptional regulator [Lentzea sp. NPDC058436]|uniref:BTAD domain-containing putative transcriptional regulator n=1 Tax=Lentzea sp. NPDC058436 TaxID=3346499 RepID=UPI0036540E03